jgi:hypothetical protein
MLEKNSIKNLIFPIVSSHLESEGFLLKDNANDPRFIQYAENEVNYFYFNFDSNGSVFVSGIFKSIGILENEIMNIEFPGLNKELLLKRNYYFLNTVKDTHFENLFKEQYRYKVFKSEEEVVAFAHWLGTYIKNIGLPFAQHYSYLPNILAKMDELDLDKIPWHKRGKGILAGTLDGYFRGLLISKLCGDVDVIEKIERLDEKFKQEIYVEWLPYYQKLKNRLENLEPKYEASTGSVFEYPEV